MGGVSPGLGPPSEHKLRIGAVYRGDPDIAYVGTGPFGLFSRFFAIFYEDDFCVICTYVRGRCRHHQWDLPRFPVRARKSLPAPTPDLLVFTR